jgi:hypothetical protein
MLHHPKSGKLFHVILVILVLGITTACKTDTERQAVLKDAEKGSKAVAIEMGQVAGKALDQIKAVASFHTTLNVIFFGLMNAAFFAGFRKGEERKKDNDVILKSLSGHPYIEMYAYVANTCRYKPRSAR